MSIAYEEKKIFFFHTVIDLGSHEYIFYKNIVSLTYSKNCSFRFDCFILFYFLMYFKCLFSWKGHNNDYYYYIIWQKIVSSPTFSLVNWFSAGTYVHFHTYDTRLHFNNQFVINFRLFWCILLWLLWPWYSYDE